MAEFKEKTEIIWKQRLQPKSRSKVNTKFSRVGFRKNSSY